ncbi:MAG: hypothetical protein ABIJ09_07620 [Pseudomonadota bacterium]
MPMKIRDTARRLVQDGQLDRQDVAKIVDSAKDWGMVTRAEKSELKNLLTQYADKFTPEARQDLERYLGLPGSPSTPSTPTVPGSPAPTSSRSLGTNPGGEAVVLKGGLFVATADAPLPNTAVELGDSLYRAASLIAASDPKTNVFAGLSLDEKKAVFGQLQASLLKAPPDTDIPQGFQDALQPRQLRSSAATAMLELMRSCDKSQPEERLLQDSALKTYAAMAEKETASILRDSMVFQLHNNKDCLANADQRELSDRLMRLFAPTQPPYDEWFANGNKQLNVVCHTGGEFFDGEVRRWKGSGFKEVGTASSSQVELEKTFERNGVETTVRLTMVNGSGGSFDKMDDPNTHIVAYSGHASWGKTVPREMRGAPEQAGAKLMLVNQCCGRGSINKFKDKYPESQLITTRNSSYEHEDFNTFSKTIQGIAERKSWAAISNEIRGDRYSNSRDNYYFPSDAMLRMRALDRDHDGVQDIVDRLVSFNTFNVAEDTAREFTPRDAGQPADRLDGTKVHEAAQIMNTTTHFSDFTEHHGTGESFYGAGFFAPKGDDDPMVRITSDRLGGIQSYRVEVNARHAHASEEAIKAEAFFTLAHTPPIKVASDSSVDTCLKGLILAAHSLDVDSGYRDDEIFKGLLKKHGLPEIDLWTVKPCVELNHVYAGSDASIRKLREKLGPQKLDELKAALG